MNHPLRENLEVAEEEWIRCTRCMYSLCATVANWREACRSKLFPPTEAGPHMKDLVGLFLIEQLYCPSCGVLLETSLVEKGSG
jgi:hypothetical protein